MVHYFLLFAFITFLYFYVSYKKKRIINLVFFLYISHGLIMVFLNALNLFLEGINEIHNGDIIQIIYFYLEFIGFALIELFYKPKNKKAMPHLAIAFPFVLILCLRLMRCVVFSPPLQVRTQV